MSYIYIVFFPHFSWNSPSLDQEIKQTEIHLQSLANQVRNLLDTDDVVAFGPFLYVYIRKVRLKNILIYSLFNFKFITYS